MARTVVQGITMNPDERARLRDAARVVGVKPSTLAYIILREATEGFISFGVEHRISDGNGHLSEQVSTTQA